MKLTNKANLPDAIYQAVKNDPYSKGDADFSITQLLQPARQLALQIQHADEIEEDASDRIWSLLGQVVHGILERSETKAITERRLSMKIAGVTISGGMDRFCEKDSLYQDYKFTTAWKFKNNSVPEEHEQQLNCYAELLRQNNIVVNKLQIVGILRDWSKLEARRNADYPQAQVVILNVPLWTTERAQTFIKTRVLAHLASRQSLPECTESERWAKNDVYAVMKDGRKSAVKLFESENEALAFARGLGTGHSVVKRPGENVRCANYCSVSKFCSFYQKLSAGGQ